MAAAIAALSRVSRSSPATTTARSVCGRSGWPVSQLLHRRDPRP
jgi:hypothetical protein